MGKNQQRWLGRSSQYRRKSKRVGCLGIQVKEMIPEGNDQLCHILMPGRWRLRIDLDLAKWEVSSALDKSSVLAEARREVKVEQLKIQGFGKQEQKSEGASEVKGLYFVVFLRWETSVYLYATIQWGGKNGWWRMEEIAGVISLGTQGDSVLSIQNGSSWIQMNCHPQN